MRARGCPTRKLNAAGRRRAVAERRTQAHGRWWLSEVNAICGACFASSASRCRRVDMGPGSDAPAMFPSNGPVTRCPLPSAGSPLVRFPGPVGSMGHSDSLSPSRLASWWFARRYRVVRLRFAPAGPARVTGGPGVSHPVPHPDLHRGGCQGVPSSWGARRAYAVFLRPRRDRRTRPYSAPTRPPLRQKRKLTASTGLGAQSHGVGAGCLRFAVAIAGPHARLASGCRPGSTGWGWLPTGLRRKVLKVWSLHPRLLSQASWRNDVDQKPAPGRALRQ
jgi:hypothetical protein